MRDYAESLISDMEYRRILNGNHRWLIGNLDKQVTDPELRVRLDKLKARLEAQE